MNEKSYEQYDDEISLRELIEALLKGKWYIIAVTVAVIILGAIYTFGLATPTYEAETVLNATEIGTEETEDDSIDSIVDSTGNYPVTTIETYVEQLQSQEVLRRVIKALDLQDGDGNTLRVGVLSDMITVENIEDTNLIKITVDSSDAEQAANIANAFGTVFIDYIDELTQTQSNKTAEKILEQLDTAEDSLAEKSSNLSEYLSENIDIDELSSEISSLVSQVTSNKATVNNLSSTIETLKATLSTLSEEAGYSNATLDSLQLDADSSDVDPEIVVDLSNSGNLADSLMILKIVQLQNQLVQDQAQYTSLQSQIEELSQDLTDKQAELVDEKYKYNKLNREVELAQETYDAYQKRYQEVMVEEAAEIGSSSIVISSEAVAPLLPTAPNKTLNMAIALVLGVMLGIFIALFRAYWLATDKKTTVEVKKQEQIEKK